MTLQAPRTSAEINLFRQLLTNRAGIAFGQSRETFLEGRLRGRMAKAGARSLYEYYRMVAEPDGAGELQALVDELSINETSFFRSPAQFEFLGQNALPARLRARQEMHSKRLRLWSAGCSTGQELYSMAMVFLETAVFHESWDVSLLGTDVSASAVHRARVGAYEERQLTDVGALRRQRFFEKKGDRFVVRAWARRGLEFACANVLDGPPCSDIDVIFCRNVMIYFDPADQQKLLRRLAQALAPGGYLFLGHAESLLGMSDHFRTVSLRPGIVYQRRS
jgi:chemotaxis protein methyltransferase CheR